MEDHESSQHPETLRRIPNLLTQLICAQIRLLDLWEGITLRGGQHCRSCHLQAELQACSLRRFRPVEKQGEPGRAMHSGFRIGIAPQRSFSRAAAIVSCFVIILSALKVYG